MGLHEIGKDRSVARLAGYQVELFDQMVDDGDKIRWAGEEHLVIERPGRAGGRILAGFLTVAVAD